MPILFAHCLTTVQTTPAVTPRLSSVRRFQIRLNARPLVTPESRSQFSSRALHHSLWNRNCSKPSTLANQIDNDPMTFPFL